MVGLANLQSQYPFPKAERISAAAGLNHEVRSFEYRSDAKLQAATSGTLQ
jgi:hypothetical protein